MPKRVAKNRQERDLLVEADLLAAEELIRAGRFDGAAQLLLCVGTNFHGWIAANRGAATELARRIGAAYWALRMPAMAGRYWYLLDDVTGDVEVARDELERACGRNPNLVRDSLPHALLIEYGDSPGARELARRCGELRGDALIEVRQNPFVRVLAGTGCILVALAVLFVFGAGLTALFDGK